MKGNPNDKGNEPAGGRAKKRLDEFMSKRFPGENSLPEKINEPDQSNQPIEKQFDNLKQTVNSLVESYNNIKSRLEQLEKLVRDLHK